MNKASFSQFLREQCKYKENNLRESTYRYQGVTYNRVEALDNDTIIQAFVIMSERQVAECEKFPFYRSYYQRNDYGYIVPPACNIAVFHKDDGEWHIHSASDPKLELTNPDFLNYDKAVERFRNRFSFCGNQKLARQIKRLSYSFLTVVIIYCVAHILCINGLLFGFVVPMNSTVLILFVLIVVLLLLPPMVPYIKSITIKDVGVELNR